MSSGLETGALTPGQRRTFETDGVIRLNRLLPAQTVAAARQSVLAQLAKIGLWRDGAWRLDAAPRPRWPDAGLKTSRVIGNRHEALSALIADPTLRGVVDLLLGGKAIASAGAYRRPQVLFTLPNADLWSLPEAWHTDSPRLASGQSPGVQIFTFLEPVDPAGGGTVVIAGSHRLMNEGRHIRPKDLVERLEHQPEFRQLIKSGAQAELNPVALPGGIVSGVPLRLIEMTGSPGDVWLMDLGAIHGAAPNAGVRPRLMLTHRYERADLLAEVARAWGWS